MNGESVRCRKSVVRGLFDHEGLVSALEESFDPGDLRDYFVPSAVTLKQMLGQK